MHSVTSAVRWQSNHKDGASHPWLRNAMSIISAAKWMIRTSWAPHFCCVTCSRLLTAWAKVSHSMPFAIPMVWRETTGHVSECYFCQTSITGVTAKSKHTVQYPNLPSTMRTVHHCAELPVPKPPTKMLLNESEWSDEDVSEANKNIDCDPTFAGASSSNELHLLTQGDLNAIIRDLNVSKKQAELIGRVITVSNTTMYI